MSLKQRRGVRRTRRSNVTRAVLPGGALGFTLLALAATFALSTPAAADSYTWTGGFGTTWNTGGNWGNVTFPNSANDQATFTGAALGTVNIASSVQTQAISFSNPTGAYTLTSSANQAMSDMTAINVAAGVTGTQTINLANIPSGSLQFPPGTSSSLTITNNSTAAGTTLVIGPNTVIGSLGTGGVVVAGAGTTQISGQFATSVGWGLKGGLYISGPGTLILSPFSSLSYTGGTFVIGGTLLLAGGTPIPATTNVTVFSSGQFKVGAFAGNTPQTAIGTLALNGSGAFVVPSGSPTYYLNQLTMSGGLVDLSGATNSVLRFANSDAAITTNASSTTANWIGPIGSSTSHIQNDTASPLTINVAAGTTASGIDLDSSINLSSAGTNPTFVKSGLGTMRLTSLGNTANIEVQQGTLRVNDLATGGVGALGSGAITLYGGFLVYGGPSAATTKNLTLAANSAIQVLTPGANLTLSSAMTEAGGNGNLTVLGPGAGSSSSTLTVAATNSYSGSTRVQGNAILAIPTISNVGQPSSIGTGIGFPSAPVLLGTGGSRGTLLLTGTNSTYTSDRIISVSGTYGAQAGGAIGVQNMGTNLTLTGPIRDTGSLIKIGPGTLTLANATNNYTGGTYVEEGRLALGSGFAIPTGGNVTVQPGAVFDVGSATNNNVTGIGTLTLNGGTLTASTGNATAYNLNRLVIGATGGIVNASGSSGNSGLSFVGAGAGITINGNSLWSGPGTSYIANNTGAEMPITIAPNVTLETQLTLASFGPPFTATPFLITGGGTLRITNFPSYIAYVRVNHARLLESALFFSPGNFDLTLDAGTFAYDGPTTSSSSSFCVLGPGGGTVEIVLPNSALTFTGTITGTDLYPLTKTGPGTLVLNNPANTYAGGITVTEGRLDVGNDAQLGRAAVTVNPLGTLRYTASTTTTARRFTLFSGALEAAAGVTVTMNGASVGGGFLRGPGTFALTGGTALSGVTTQTSTTIIQTGPASVANFTNGGSFTVNSGQTLAWNGGTNTSSGRVVVNGTANVSDFVSNGQVNIPNGGVLNNAASPLVLGGGSRTFIGSAATPGGTLNLNGQTLELNGGLLANFGAISGGTINVNYGGLAAGNGTFGTVVIHPGGAYTPGVTLANIPPPQAGAYIRPLDPNQSTATAVVLDADTLATVAASDGTLTFTNPITATAGKKLTKSGGGTLAVAALRIGGLAIDDATVRVLPNGTAAGTSSLASLSITSPTGRLDLTDNKLVIFGGNVAAITALIASGRNGGAWNGSGIVTSLASGNFTTLGVATAQQAGRAGGTFGGVPVAAADVLIMYTYGGDANLDGKINVDDYGHIDSSIGIGLTGWFNGDFNYDGKINVDDYGIIDFNIGIQGPPFPTTTSVAQGLWATSVPEAIFPLPYALAFAGLFRRQRHRLVVE